MALIAWLRFSGARLVTGLPVASGKAYFYVPGTSRADAVTIYADHAETEPLGQPVTLDASGRAEVYCSVPSEVVVLTSSDVEVASSTTANDIDAMQVVTRYRGTAMSLDDALTEIFDSITRGHYTIAESGSATPTFEFDPDVDKNVFVCSYSGEVSSITVAWPASPPEIEPGTRFTMIFLFDTGTTFDGTISWGANIVERSSDKLLLSDKGYMWTADFIKSPDGPLVQATPWCEAQAASWSL
jgi:hypothetical protein